MGDVGEWGEFKGATKNRLCWSETGSTLHGLKEREECCAIVI